MRKRNCDHLFDTLFWYILYAFPFILYLLYMNKDISEILSFGEFFNSLGFEFVSNNIIVDGFSALFGVNGILPLFANDLPFIMFSWFICVFICHLAVDFLLFIPRYAHKLMDTFSKKE